MFFFHVVKYIGNFKLQDVFLYFSSSVTKLQGWIY
jgi:hypothetical protein